MIPVTSSSVTVLVVDDQPPFLRAARSVVDLTPGFEMIGEAETGEEALERIDALAPDLVLMDINLPGINGVEAARRVIAAHPEIRVLLLSTYAADDILGKARSFGATYMKKEEFGPASLTKAWEQRPTRT
jgi:DNA-binding NarL/FixJ family response regulator